MRIGYEIHALASVCLICTNFVGCEKSASDIAYSTIDSAIDSENRELQRLKGQMQLLDKETRQTMDAMSDTAVQHGIEMPVDQATLDRMDEAQKKLEGFVADGKAPNDAIERMTQLRKDPVMLQVPENDHLLDGLEKKLLKLATDREPVDEAIAKQEKILVELQVRRDAMQNQHSK